MQLILIPFLDIYFGDSSSSMSLFVIPTKVVTRLERIQKNFLWGEMEERRKFHSVNWAKICKDKKHGGLGLRHLEGLNQALLGKWLWRLSLEREGHWRKVILGRFGEVEGCWTTRKVRDSYELSLWKDIRKGWEKFTLRTSICIGNSIRTRFWWDSWAGKIKLKDVYPTLFKLFFPQECNSGKFTRKGRG